MNWDFIAGVYIGAASLATLVLLLAGAVAHHGRKVDAFFANIIDENPMPTNVRKLP